MMMSIYHTFIIIFFSLCTDNLPLNAFIFFFNLFDQLSEMITHIHVTVQGNFHSFVKKRRMCKI